MADFVGVPVGGGEGAAGGQVVLFQSANSDLVSLHAGRPSVGELAADAKGRLEAIAAAAEEVYQESFAIGRDYALAGVPEGEVAQRVLNDVRVLRKPR